MNETKVNTKNCDVTSPDSKKAFFDKNHVGIISTPYGHQLIEAGGAVDHASMRSCQLGSLLRLMQTENSGAARFCQLGQRAQDSLLWLAVQLADEVEAMIDIVTIDAKEGRA